MCAQMITELPLKIVAVAARREPGHIGISIFAWSCLRAGWSLLWLVGALVAVGVGLFLVSKEVDGEPAPSATVGYAFGILGGYLTGFVRPGQAIRTQAVNFISWYASNEAPEADKQQILDIAAAARMGDIPRAVARFQRAVAGD